MKIGLSLLSHTWFGASHKLLLHFSLHLLQLLRLLLHLLYTSLDGFYLLPKEENSTRYPQIRPKGDSTDRVFDLNSIPGLVKQAQSRLVSFYLPVSFPKGTVQKRAFLLIKFTQFGINFGRFSA